MARKKDIIIKLQRILMTSDELEELFRTLPLEFPKDEVSDDLIERNETTLAKRLPMFTDVILAFEYIPTFDEYFAFVKNYVLDNDKDHPGEDQFADHLGGVKWRSRRTYPAALREMYFVVLLTEHFGKENVFLSRSLDKFAKVDVIVRINGNVLSYHIYDVAMCKRLFSKRRKTFALPHDANADLFTGTLSSIPWDTKKELGYVAHRFYWRKYFPENDMYIPDKEKWFAAMSNDFEKYAKPETPLMIAIINGAKLAQKEASFSRMTYINI